MCECVCRCVCLVFHIFRAKDRVEKILLVELGGGPEEERGRCLSVNEKRTFQGLHVEEGPGTGISQYVRVCPSIQGALIGFSRVGI